MEFVRSSSSSVQRLRLPVTIKLPRSFVTALLASAFYLAFLLTDYWNIPAQAQDRLRLLILTIALGIGWSVLAAGEASIVINLKYWWAFALLAAGLLMLNFLPLASVIPWRGDEDYHMIRVLSLIERVQWDMLIPFLLFWLGILFLAWWKPFWAIIAGAFFLWRALVTFPQATPLATLRYPYVNYWLLALAPALAKQVASPYHEFLYRIIPFLSVVALTWYFQRNLTREVKPMNLLWGLAVATIPVVYYYSSILYLELPAIFLMTIVCLRSEQLLTKDYSALKQDSGWYALILIGFIKETTLPFLVCFLFFRTAIILWRRLNGEPVHLEPGNTSGEARKTSLYHTLLAEAAVYFVVLLPVVYYIGLRTTLASTREYAPAISNLMDFSVYPVMAFSFLEQFGMFIFLFLGGCILLIKFKKYSLLGFYAALVFSYSLFFMIDVKGYIGYSRFNLFYLPVILAGSSFMITALIEKRKSIGYLLAIVAIVSSLALSPVQIDGSKAPGWGNYLMDISEHYYPIDKAISWLQKNHPDGDILIAGLYYDYFFDFYANKQNWAPPRAKIMYSNSSNQDDSANLAIALTEAEKQGYNIVLFFVLGKDIPRVPENSPFHQEHVISNLAHSLVVYSRDR